MSNRHYTVISRGDDFDELLPPANVTTPPQASRGARCCALAGAVLLLAAAIMAVAIPLALLGRSTSHMDSIHLEFEREKFQLPAPNSDQLTPQSVSLIGSKTTTSTIASTTTTASSTAETLTTASSANTTNSNQKATSTVGTDVNPSKMTSVQKSSEINNTSNNSANTIASSTSSTVASIVNTDSSTQPHPQIVHIGETGRIDQIQEHLPIGLLQRPPISSTEEEQSSSTAVKFRKWLKQVQEDPAFVPAAVAAAVLVILVAMITAHAINRRIKRRNRRRHLGRLVTDLQQGDKVMLMGSDEE